MAVTPTFGTLSGLARPMVQHGRLPETVAQELQKHARESGAGFIEQVARSRRMSFGDIAEFCSYTFGLPLLDLDACDPAQFPIDLVDRKLMQTRRVRPPRQRGNPSAVARPRPPTTQ